LGTKINQVTRIAATAITVVILAAPAFSSTTGKAAELSPDRLLRKGYGELCLGLSKPAIADLTKATKLRKNNVSARRFLCYALLQDGDFSEALNQMKTLTKNEKPEAIDYYLLGEIHLSLGWIDAAEIDFKDALALTPGLKAARAGLIRVTLTNGDYDAALKMCQECMNDTKPADANASGNALNDYFKRLYAFVRLAQSNSAGGLPEATTETQQQPAQTATEGAQPGMIILPNGETVKGGA